MKSNDDPISIEITRKVPMVAPGGSKMPFLNVLKAILAKKEK